MTAVGFLPAFLGGVLALLSPCSALLLPAFFAYAFQQPRQLLGRTLLFYVGLCLTLVPLGAGSAAVSGLFYGHRQTLIGVAGIVLIALGILQALGGGFVFGPLQRLFGRIRGGGPVAVCALGAVYGLAGFCSGPILGSVLTVAMADGRPGHGAALLATYALGMVVPLVIMALLWDRFDLGQRRILRGRHLRLGRLRLHTTSLASGLLFAIVGVVFLTFDGTAGIVSPVGVDTEYEIQLWISRVGDHVPDVVLPIVVAGLATLALCRRVRRRRRGDDRAGTPAPDGPGHRRLPPAQTTDTTK